MHLETVDFIIVFVVIAITLLIGLSAARRSSKSSKEFFLSGKSMPWWMLGLSMVATTFATDTPNLVTDLVRNNGIAGNWVWWAFLLTGMLTVFVYAAYWYKSGVSTDIEFYELRYGGKPAQFLRLFRAIYLGFGFNVLSMSAVSLAAIKIGEILFDFEPITTIGIASAITLLFSTAGGLRGVILTDIFLFFVAMAGSIAAAVYIVGLPEVGGLAHIKETFQDTSTLSMIPEWNSSSFYTLLLIPLAVQWWASWYPGSEPGGGGYIAQRMLGSKGPMHAVGATLFFNLAHYALRPWPWILIALASMIVFPDLDSITNNFQHVSSGSIGNDIAYPAMLTLLPAGLLGLVVAALAAAYMSTISTHLNWGSSYLVNDVYKRFYKPNASEKELVTVGRIITILLLIVSTLLALYLKSAKQVFEIIIQFGAGTGLIFILRWFWWRINAWSEISAMFVSGIIALTVNFTPILSYLNITSEYSFLIVVAITTITWLLVTFLTKPESSATLTNFAKTIEPPGKKWQEFYSYSKSNSGIKIGLLAMLIGCIGVYSLLFGMGQLLVGTMSLGILLLAVTAISGLILYKLWNKIESSY